MKLTKKQILTILAAAVSVCFVMSLLSTVRAVMGAVQSGAAVPYGMVMLTLVTAVCTFTIWRGVREMD